MNPFIIILIVLDIGAAGWEMFHQNPVKCWYWLSAASITASVVWLK